VSAPDYAEPLIGWRVWCVVDTADGLRLSSVIHDELWPVETELVARCRARERPSNTLLLGQPQHAAPGV